MKNKKQTKKAVVYAKVASPAVDTTQQSTDSQERACREWARQNGYEIVGEYQDVCFNDSKLDDRKALIDTIARCQSKTSPIDVLLVTDLDRLSRNTVELLFIKSQIDLNGTKIITVNQQMTEDFTKGQLFESVIASANAFSRTIERRKYEKSSNL